MNLTNSQKKHMDQETIDPRRGSDGIRVTSSSNPTWTEFDGGGCGGAGAVAARPPWTSGGEVRWGRGSGTPARRRRSCAPAAVPPRSPCAARGQGVWPAANNACSSPAAAARVPAERIPERWSQREMGDGVARSGGDVELSTRCRWRARGMAPPAKADPAALACVRCG